jgi:hypothetical protein
MARRYATQQNLRTSANKLEIRHPAVKWYLAVGSTGGRNTLIFDQRWSLLRGGSGKLNSWDKWIFCATAA